MENMMGRATGVKTRCPNCAKNGRDRTGDNFVEYDDGSHYCFSCGYTDKTGKEYDKEMDATIEQLPVRELVNRGITQEIAERWNVKCECSKETGEPIAYYYPLFKEGLVGYQKKTISGDSCRVGETRGSLPFGSHIAGSKGKMLIVVEGAEDAMAVDQMLLSEGKRWRVVATLGTHGWKHNLEYFANFEKVVIAYDMDAPGREAAKEFALALKPDQGVVASWDAKDKDPNDLLLHGKAKAFIDSIHKAKPVQLDGIITGEEAWNIIKNYTQPESVPYPAQWPKLQAALGGMRAGEISMWTSGTGSGKSTSIRFLKQHLVSHTDWKVGDVELEETVEKTIRSMLQFQAGKPLIDMSQEEKRDAWAKTYGTGRLFTLDHRSRYTKGQSLMGKLRHLAYSEGCRVIFLDHINLAQAEFGDGYEGLRQQDQMMADFLEFVETSGVHLCLISHLRKAPSGSKGFETGVMPTLDDLRGSGSCKQIAFDIIAIARNTLAENELEKNTVKMCVLKNRENGNTGPCDTLVFDKTLMTFKNAEEAAYEEEF